MMISREERGKELTSRRRRSRRLRPDVRHRGIDFTAVGDCATIRTRNRTPCDRVGWGWAAAPRSSGELRAAERAGPCRTVWRREGHGMSANA